MSSQGARSGRRWTSTTSSVSGGQLSVSNYSTAFNAAEYVEVPHDDAQNSPTAFSFFAWIKRNPTAVGNNAIATKWTFASDGGFGLQLQQSIPTQVVTFVADAVNSNGDAVITTTGDPIANADQWYHVGFTFAPGDVHIYVDGVDQAINVGSAIPSAMQTPTAPLRIGNWSGSLATRFFDGLIDEVTLWSTTLSQAEVTELYSAGAPADPQQHSASSSLISYYPLGDAPGDYATSNEIVDVVGGLSGSLINGDVNNRSSDVP